MNKFAWWGTGSPSQDAVAAGLPAGTPASLTIALPDAASRSVQALSVPVALVDAPDALTALTTWRPGDRASRSLRVWARIAVAAAAGGDVEGLVSSLPIAGHAAVGLDTTTIWSAASTVDAALHRRAGEPTLLRAELRPYQRAGVAWMNAVATSGGGILADEMGLGKTVQAIAVFTLRRDAPHLVVCPTSLVGNWARELTKFAPGIKVHVHHGASRTRSLEHVGPGSVVITSYPTLRSDADMITEVDWDTVVLDEAQQIKNSDSQQARAARRLQAHLRIAMTGTPVENRLDELWSLMAFASPDVLGARARFRRRFVVSIEQKRSDAAAGRLRELVGPHILRRRKVDVAPELPAKVMNSVVCTLTQEQERLYRRHLDSSLTEGFGTGIGRRGRILTLLTRLKQICNHPELVDGTGAEIQGRSGKLDRVTEMLSEIVDDGQAALVFTQYRGTGELLSRHLGDEVTGHPVPFLHGGLSTAARETMVDEFQSGDGPPILILSLRAAGFGLNLTRASHVVHFDRWWNPAVESQASDRAHRIGQTQTVTVHTLLTERTLEQSIDDMHGHKRDLADIATSEATLDIGGDLAKLSDGQLRELLEIGAGQ
ncbi:DEAD/DEAH box helicase [Rhodococcoides fascians]|uniref:DEAD/DEAH box helicase n=1 Tax=Rhodococcoides fascians TaxID=1828 RepID=UPI00055E5A74|nr:DEAD/DEAH box helicase [Rhodococcus fascians]